jgi:hypothetical protein
MMLLGLFAASCAALCGNNIVEVGESCDGGLCCTASCNFVGPGVVCHQPVSACDSGAVCSGYSALCPVAIPYGPSVVCKAGEQLQLQRRVC